LWVAVREGKAPTPFYPVHISRSLTAAENSSSPERLLEIGETLFFLRVRDGREAKYERDETEPFGSMHCELGWKRDVSGAGWDSGASLYERIDALFLALPASDYASESADDADECPAVGAGIAFGCTLLVLAGTADHCISFA
jgi:hypothetical protein